MVLYARSMGPYQRAAEAAWQTMSRWLDSGNRRSLMRVSYGLFRDNPRTTAPELLRYDACVPLVIGLEDAAAIGIRRQVLPGGAYAVHTHVGAIEATGELFSRLYRQELPKRGLTVDEDRPFLAVYLTDPTVTREMHRRTEVCVPLNAAQLPAHVGGDGSPRLCVDSGDVDAARGRERAGPRR
jgi:AraC family transcriptional regulator